MHFCDMLPELPMPLPLAATSSLRSGNREPSDLSTQFQPVRQPQEVQPCCSSLPVPPHALFKSQSNSFGLFHVYNIRTLPCHDPMLNEPTGEHMKVDKPAGSDNPFHPYPNESPCFLESGTGTRVPFKIKAASSSSSS